MKFGYFLIAAATLTGSFGIYSALNAKMYKNIMIECQDEVRGVNEYQKKSWSKDSDYYFGHCVLETMEKKNMLNAGCDQQALDDHSAEIGAYEITCEELGEL